MLLRQTLLYIPAQLIGPLALFASAVLWTHFLPAHEYGALMLTFAFQELASLMALAWWSHYTQRFAVSLTGSEARHDFERTDLFVLALSAPVQALGILAMLWFTGLANSWQLAAAAVLYTISRSALTHYGERARTLGLTAAYTMSQSIGPVLGFALGHAAILHWGAEASRPLYGFAAAQCLALLIVWRMMGITMQRARPSRALLKQAIGYGGPLLVSGGAGWISMNGIRPIVERLADAAAVGLLSVGWGLGQRLMSVAAMLVTAAAFPLAVKRLAAGTVEDSLDQISRNGVLLAAVLFPTAAGMILISPVLIPLLVAEPFRAVTLQILPIATLAAALRNMRVHFPDQAFLIRQDTTAIFWFSMIEAAVTAAGCLAGYKSAGIAGAAIGCLAGTAFGALLVFAWAALKLGLKLPWSHFLRIAAATAAMTALLGSISWQPTLWSVAQQVCLGGLVYAAAMAALHWSEVSRLIRSRPPSLPRGV